MDEVQRLIIDVQNAAKVKELTELLTAQKRTIEELAKLQAAGGPLQAGQQRMLDAAGAGAVAAQRQIQSLTATSAWAKQNAMMNAGYLAQDALSQHSLAGAINAGANNIPMIAQGMGAGPQAMIGVMVATAIIQALPLVMPKIMELITGENERAKKEREAREKDAKDIVAEDAKLGQAPEAGEAARGADIAARIKALGGGAYAAVRGVMGDQPVTLGEVHDEIKKQGKSLLTAGKMDWESAANVVKARKQAERAELLLKQAGMGGPEGAAAIAALVQLSRDNPENEDLRRLAAELTFNERGGADVGPPEPRDADPHVGPGRAEFAGQIERDATRHGGPAYLPSPNNVFGRGVPPDAAALQAEARAKAAAFSDARQRARQMEQEPHRMIERTGTDNAGSPDRSELIHSDAQEMQLLQGKRAMLEAEAAADQMLGMNGPALQAYSNLTARIQALAAKLGGAAAGSGATGQYSAMPAGPW